MIGCALQAVSEDEALDVEQFACLSQGVEQFPALHFQAILTKNPYANLQNYRLKLLLYL